MSDCKDCLNAKTKMMKIVYCSKIKGTYYLPIEKVNDLNWSPYGCSLFDDMDEEDGDAKQVKG